jgi:acetylornithine aminotransferase
MRAGASQDEGAGAGGPIHPLLAGGADYAFVRLARMRERLVPAGLEAIDFSVGDPREPTPAFIRDALRAAVPEVSSYPAVAGMPELRAACAGWLERRFGVRMDPAEEVLPLNGTKEGVFLLALALIGRDEPRRTVVIPTPAYPVYEPAARFAGADVHVAPLASAKGWRFDPDDVPDAVWERTALLWLNYPHNPTGAVLPPAAAARVVAKARRFGFWVAADEAYADLWFGEPPRSVLEHGAGHVLAFHTLSKRSAMTGYRSGFMAGDRRLIAALRRFRPNVGVATPEFVQRAAIAAWNDDAHAGEQRARYAAKREMVAAEFRRRGWKIEASEATFYLWVKAPGGDDVAWVERLMRRGVVATPGSFLGRGGEGFVRWALVPALEPCRAALARLDGSPDGASGGSRREGES